MTSAVVSNELIGHKREEGGNITRLSCVSVWSVDSRMPDCAARPGPGDWCGGPGCAAAQCGGDNRFRGEAASHQQSPAWRSSRHSDQPRDTEERGDQAHTGRPGLDQPPAVHPCSDTQVRGEMQELLLPDLIGPSLGMQSWIVWAQATTSPGFLHCCP